ncbi:MAG TPA: tetratricopeptide repeat protein, partial [Acidobacteriota bacterium]|nr:tetratricopeptide repeat protein [Acidobacteriota bacterium]
MRSQRVLWKISIWLLALTGWFNLATVSVIAQRTSSPKNGKKVESTRNAASEDTALGESLDDRQALAAQKFDTGQDFHAQGKLTDAIKLYDEALQLDDQLFAVHYQRGIALLSLNRFEDAAASLTRCVELQDDFARGFAMLGEAQLRCKKPVEAEKAFLRATELDSSLGFARFGAAQLMLARKAPTEALTLLKELAQTPPEDPVFYAVYAEAQRLSGDAPGAFQTLSDGLTRFGNQPQLLRGRAMAYLNQKNYPKALADFQAVYTIEPDPVLARDMLDLYRAAKLTEDGIQFAQVAFKQYSSNGPLRAAFGELLMEGNRTTEAIEQYSELTKQEPKNATWWVKLGDAAQATDPAVALNAYQKALSINPRSP